MWRRRLLAAATAASLLLATALAALYVRSFFARDELTVWIGDGPCTVATFPHHFYAIVARSISADGGANVPRPELQLGLPQYPGEPDFLEVRFIPSTRDWSVAVPYWFPALFTLAVPLWRLCAWWHVRRRARQGLCAACGYDLRASADRCPECGTSRPVPGPTALA
jgi:hypothetical protein